MTPGLTDLPVSNPSAVAPPPAELSSPSRRRRGRAGVRGALKGLGHLIGLTLVALPALLCRLEARCSGRNELFVFCGQSLGLVPGLPGKFLRRCFYYLTLEAGTLNFEIDFLSHFNDRRVRIGERVYVGANVNIGSATLGDGCLIGSRTSILNGGYQHRLGADGRLTAFDRSRAPRVHVGAETWIGEGAILMADVGSRCVVAAGSVVSSPVPDGCVVGGNPARFIGKVSDSLIAVTPASARRSAP